MQSQIGIETGAGLQFVVDQTLPASWTDLRFPADSKAQQVHFAASAVSAERVVFNREANWLRECIHQHASPARQGGDSVTSLRRLSK